MPSVSLESYLIKVREKNSNQDLDFDCIGPDNLCLNEIILEYLERRKTGKLIESTEKLLQIQEYDYDEESEFIRGRLERGAYGFSSKIIDIESNDLKYDKAADEAEMLPFYFLSLLPERYDRGLLLLQTFGQYGFKTDFEKDLNDYINEKDLNITIQINSLAPKKVIENYINNGSIKKLRLIKYTMPEDMADWHIGERFKDECYMELSINAKNRYNINHLKDTFSQLVDGTIETNEMIEIEDLNFKYDDVKIELKIGNKRRTVNLTDLSKVRGKFDVTSEVDILDSGHPTYDSINEEAEDLIKELGNSIGIL